MAFLIGKQAHGSTSCALIAAVIASAWAASAVAQVPDAALAESLFREGKRLSGEHKFAEACPKFAESYKLDPGLGTLLNLAACHESEGKPASAWAEFSDASARAKREGDNDRAQLADEHVRALEPKLSHITIAVAPGAAIPGLVVKFDSRELSSAALGMSIPIDPGKHQIEASAPGKQSYSQTLDAPAAGATATVTVPLLQDAPNGAPAVAPVVAPAAAGPTPPAAAPAVTEAPTSDGAKSHVAVIASGVATGAFVVGATITGILYSSKRSDFNSANSEQDPSRFDKRDSAKTLGTVNLVLTGGALISAGFLVYFLATGSHESAPAQAAKLQVIPDIGPTGGGLTLRGTL